MSTSPPQRIHGVWLLDQHEGLEGEGEEGGEVGDAPGDLGVARAQTPPEEPPVRSGNVPIGST